MVPTVRMFRRNGPRVTTAVRMPMFCVVTGSMMIRCDSLTAIWFEALPDLADGCLRMGSCPACPE